MSSDHFYNDETLMQSSTSAFFCDTQWSPSQLSSLPTLGFDSTPFPTPSTAGMRPPPPLEIASTPLHLLDIPRPKSSPCIFNSNVEDLIFEENPFKINRDEWPKEYPILTLPPSPISANLPAYESIEIVPQPILDHHEQSRPTIGRHFVSASVPPENASFRQQTTLKRLRDDDEFLDMNQRRRKRAVSCAPSMELSEEERLLIKLKEEENLPWKEIATRFQTDINKAYQVPALQMRYKRLRERLRTWTDVDVEALEQAFDYWEKYQFEIISSKMLEFGSSERWPAKYCLRKWEELHPGRISYHATPAFLQEPWQVNGHLSPAQSMRYGSLEPLYGHSPRVSMSRSPRPSVDI